MPKYNVVVEQCTVQTCDIEVEATDIAEATLKALEAAEDEKFFDPTVVSMDVLKVNSIWEPEVEDDLERSHEIEAVAV